MTDKQIIIEDCPHFIGECCQEYLDGICENHKCDLKIIRELEQKLKAKEQSEEKLVKQIQTICDFINNRPEIFKGVNGSVDKIITDYAKAKEQECEGLKEAQKNSRCAWKSFEGTFCPEAQEQLNAYKMEADEGKEINAELKAENEEWKKANDCILTTLNVIAEGNKKLRQILTEIKEIAEIAVNFCKGCGGEDYECIDCTNGGRAQISKEILQKISEVENEEG